MCTHPPVVTAEQYDFHAKAGETVFFKVTAVSADGKGIHTHWFLYKAGSSYNGNECNIRPWHMTDGNTKFTVPDNAHSEDLFIFCFVA